MENNDFINFEDLRSTLEIKDSGLFQVYLKELFKDLSDRAESCRKTGISKITFSDFIKLPYFIGEKLFYALDRDNDSHLNSKEFGEGLFKLYMGDFYETVEVIFNILDFDKDGWIEKGDTGILLSYLPLKSDLNKELKDSQHYKYQMDSLNEIEELIKFSFGEKEKLDLKEFSSVIQNTKSDIFLQIICFLYLNKPFNEQNIEAYQTFKKRGSTGEISPSKSKNAILTNSPGKISPPKSESSIRMPSPSRKSLLHPAETFIKINLESNSGDESDPSYDSNENCDEEIKIDLPLEKKKSLIKDSPSKNMDMLLVRMDNTKLVDSPIKDSNNENNTDVNELIKKSKGIMDSPSTYFRKRGPGKVSEFNLEGNLISLDSNSTNKVDKSSPNHKRPVNRKYTNPKQEIIYENWVYKLTQNNKIKKYFLVLVGKDIYYYKSENKEELMGMHNLSGCFVKEGGEKKIEGKKFYSLSIIFSSKTRNYFAPEKQEITKWIKSLKSAIGYQSFFDYYDILDDLGEGKFGMVKLGVHKNTGEKVAIKIIKKETMTTNDMELVRSETDIMKLCKHPNVVRLLDHFENSEYIFIVMEYLSGGDLGEFFSQNDFKFDEPTAAKIMTQIAQGIRYLHQFGIVHRDLKPENIMLSDHSKNPTLKVMDFGLSKILGPLEKACDGFGTLSFVAPEVLIRQPYNKQIDIWSIGVILYYMLSGILPFDDESDNEEIIAKRTVFVELQFPSKNFKNRSNEVLDLISKCLIKDPNKRISIDEFLNHEWVKKFV